MDGVREVKKLIGLVMALAFLTIFSPGCAGNAGNMPSEGIHED